MMQPTEKEEFRFALADTLKFYKKTLSAEEFPFWYQSLKSYNVKSVKVALRDYVKIGKYAPKPANIVELINQSKGYHKPALEAPDSKPYNPEIAHAWLWFIGYLASCSEIVGGIFREILGLPLETQEKYLLIVNQEARRCNCPEAVPDEYRLPEVWVNHDDGSA